MIGTDPLAALRRYPVYRTHFDTTRTTARLRDEFLQTLCTRRCHFLVVEYADWHVGVVHKLSGRPVCFLGPDCMRIVTQYDDWEKAGRLALGRAIKAQGEEAIHQRIKEFLSC